MYLSFMITMPDCEASESQVTKVTETISERPTEPLNSTLHKTQEMLSKTSISYSNATVTSKELNISYLTQV